ncbi:ABC transporter substrate-binding protein [Maritalea porphyrae]|uniref:Iron ABC transporter substrate-binding protein n=1 Tax=Maritalea porphyrae TaxID=880732 RepID=A0ABQ5URX8_9HYPH|nr:ABC transporter substrate-binding protein [Maritalea porphyrae]GLQ18033.1 iron ABC transporter substrate-binding protein [Maritalea porphyrae]
MLRSTFAALLVAATSAIATAEPVTVTDIAGRTVTLDAPAERIVISEGRYVPLLAVLNPENPLEGIVGMMNSIGWTDPVFERQVFEKFPKAKDIQLFGKSNKESVSVEKIIDLAPQLAIFGINDHGPDAKNKELIDQLTAAGTQIVFIDFRMDPLGNTQKSVELLGKVLGHEENAKAFNDFYGAKLSLIKERVAKIEERPNVFLQVHVGRFDCCWAMADGMLGPFVEVAGGNNIADKVAPGPTAQHTAEFLLTENPDVWIGTASGSAKSWSEGQPPMALGGDVDPTLAYESLAKSVSAEEFAALDAVKNKRAHAIWHNFYNTPFNIVALEAFAKWIHPEAFADLDPAATYNEIFERFTPFEVEGTYVASLR